MFCVIIKYDPVYINIYRCFALRGNPFSIIYIIKQDIRICIYMLRIADQTAGPIGLILLCKLMGGRGGL